MASSIKRRDNYACDDDKIVLKEYGQDIDLILQP